MEYVDPTKKVEEGISVTKSFLGMTSVDLTGSVDKSDDETMPNGITGAFVTDINFGISLEAVLHWSQLQPGINIDIIFEVETVARILVGTVVTNEGTTFVVEIAPVIVVGTIDDISLEIF